MEQAVVTASSPHSGFCMRIYHLSQNYEQKQNSKIWSNLFLVFLVALKKACWFSKALDMRLIPLLLDLFWGEGLKPVVLRSSSGLNNAKAFIEITKLSFHAPAGVSHLLSHLLPYLPNDPSRHPLHHGQHLFLEVVKVRTWRHRWRGLRLRWDRSRCFLPVEGHLEEVAISLQLVEVVDGHLDLLTVRRQMKIQS